MKSNIVNDHPEPSLTISGDPSPPDEGPQTAARDRIRKRRRTVRACDVCRRKKIKCDGRAPCEHCTGYDYECTYDKPSARRSKFAPDHVEKLESRLHRAEMLLRHLAPGADLDDSSLDPAEVGGDSTELASIANKTFKEGAKERREAQLLATVKSVGQLDLSEAGEWDFHGMSSSAVFLRGMKGHFRGLMSYDYRAPFLPGPSRDGINTAHFPTVDYPRSITRENMPIPPQAAARRLCYCSLNCATCVLRIVHVSSFFEMFEQLYRMPDSAAFTYEEYRFLPLFYAVLALGCMYDIDPDDRSNPDSYKQAMEPGFKFFSMAKALLDDITECRDMTSLQSLLFMIQFLQATSNFRACYALVGVALRSACGMGLHRYIHDSRITAVEDETRRRVFHVVRQMDIQISTILGLPILLSDDDIDQPLPSEIDDEFITDSGLLTPPPGTPCSFFKAFNANVRLNRILAGVVKHIYPLKGMPKHRDGGEAETYMISYSRIKEFEQDLHEWLEDLPVMWRPNPDGPADVFRVGVFLRFAYAYVQLILYRPFLHFISPRLVTGDKPFDERAYACAIAGLSISRNIVHMGQEVRKQAVLTGPYWVIVYTQFLATLSLMYYVLENPDKPDCAEVLSDAKSGRDAIASFAWMSPAADRITNALSSLLETLPNAPKKADQAHTINLPSPQAPPFPHAIQGDQVLPAMQRLPTDPKISGTGPSTEFSECFLSTLDHMPNDMTESLAGFSTKGEMSGLAPTSADGRLSPLKELESMMFPSGDPFTYPQEIPVSKGLRNLSSQVDNGTTSLDLSQCFMPSFQRDIDGQLLEPHLASLIQPWEQGGPDLTSHMGQISSMFGLQPAQAVDEPNSARLESLYAGSQGSATDSRWTSTCKAFGSNSMGNL